MQNASCRKVFCWFEIAFEAKQCETKNVTAHFYSDVISTAWGNFVKISLA